MKEGSQWRKWNFHVHTKGTNKNDQFSSPTMDDFFYDFYKKAYVNKIAAIGITDYFSIDRYLEAVAYKNAIRLKKDGAGLSLFSEQEIEFIDKIFIFPNVELRMFPVTDKGKLVNIHCLFNPDYVSALDNDFFAHVENEAKFKMNRYGIASYGRHLDPSISSEQKQYEKGIENFAVEISCLMDLSSKKNFRDNTIFVVSNSNYDGASGFQKHYDSFENEIGSLAGVRSSIYKISDAIFSGSAKDIKYFVGKRLEGTDGYNDNIYKSEVDSVIRQCGSLKPCLVGCDAHREDELFRRFTWVKAELTFEGLRQVCFEPESRVKIQVDMPDYKEEKLLIEKVRFLSPKNTFSSNYIFFNPNLNVIIGGKSSGKSILLYSIAKTLSADLAVLKNEEDLFKYDLNKIENGFDFEVFTKGGFSQNLVRDKEVNSILPEIKYIPQSYLVRLAEPDSNKTGRPLNKIVRDLIIEDDSSKELYQGFIDKVTRNDSLRNAQIDLYFETKRQIGELEIELKSKSSKEVLEKNIDSNTKKVEELNKNSGFTLTELQDYAVLQDMVENNAVKLRNFKEDYNVVQGFNTELLQSIRGLKQRRESFLASIQLDDIKSYYKEQYLVIDGLLELATAISESLQAESKDDGSRGFKESCKFGDVFNAIVNEKRVLNDAIEPYLKNKALKESIDEINQSIANDKKALFDIVNITSRLQGKKQLLDNVKSEIFSIYESSYKEYIAAIDGLKDRTIELEKDGLSIIGKAQFNFPKLRKELALISDKRSAAISKHVVLSQDNKATDEVSFSTILDGVKLLFEDIVGKEYPLTSKASVPNAIKVVLDDYFFDYWEINYKSDRLGEMSTGKASFVILMLIIGLSKSKAPILIDQPEDNLDNRSITTDLVNYLRIKKLDRQIIIVTHNANIVVNADAENVIVANQKGQNNESSTSPFRFDYINGAIENSFDKNLLETDVLKSMGIRQHIADIVEGGKEAFIMREKKYRFN